MRNWGFGNFEQADKSRLDADQFDPMGDNWHTALTKRELHELLMEAQRQKAAYEKKNGVLLADERKKALYD